MEQVAYGDEQHRGGIALHELRQEREVESRENLVQHQLDRLHRVGTENQPSEGDQVKGENDAQEAYHGVHILAQHLCPGDKRKPHLVQGQCHTVQRTPQYKADGGTVPQTTQQHRDEQVKVGAQLAFAVASQRDVEVVSQPRRERDVPTSPELGDGGRVVGGIEVLGEVEAHQKGQTDGHIRVAREVAVDLQRVAVDAHQTLHARVEQRLIEDAVDKV